MSDSCFHPLHCPEGVTEPMLFTYPFYYTPHPLCLQAAQEVRGYLRTFQPWLKEAGGKMFGVLVVRHPQQGLGFVAAFSGNLDGRNQYDYFVPPVYDLLNPGGYFVQEEAAISALNQQVARLMHEGPLQRLQEQLHEAELQAQAEIARLKGQKNLTAETAKHQFLNAEITRCKRKFKALHNQLQVQYQQAREQIEQLKTERKQRSAALQQWLFTQYRLHNGRRQCYDLMQIFREQLPPGGTGECCAPKLLQTAFLQGWKPLCMAEFWMGPSPTDELRTEGHYYPACRAKCKPILEFMLEGLAVEPNPLLEHNRLMANQLRVLYEDDDLWVVSKPSGMLSVPGKDELPSVYSVLQERYPQEAAPFMVHRLDMDTSGLLVVARNEAAYRQLQQQFIQHKVQKEYLALLDPSGRTPSWPTEGVINLPLCANPLDRPRQMVSQTYGKPAVTRYRLEGTTPDGLLRVRFFPLTGRTHQLRVHAAHPQGLHCPIVGDNLYGRPASRLHLHAHRITFVHPTTGQTCTFTDPLDESE